MFIALDSVIIGLRALSFVAIVHAAGVAIFIVWFGRELEGSLATIRARAQIAAFTAMLLEMGYFLLIPARMGGSFGAAFDPALDALLAEAGVKSSHAVRFVGLALLVVNLDEQNRLKTAGCLLGTTLALGSFALIGHTTIHPWRPALAALLLLHLVTAAFWFGALWPLASVVDREPSARAGMILGRFSALAIRAVPLLALCGVAMALVFVRSVAELMTGYGALLLLKATAYAALIGLAALNRRRFTPAIAAARPGAARAFKRVVAAEWALIAAVIVATALMTELFAPENLHATFSPAHDDDTMQ